MHPLLDKDFLSVFHLNSNRRDEWIERVYIIGLCSHKTHSILNKRPIIDFSIEGFVREEKDCYGRLMASTSLISIEKGALFWSLI